MTRDLLIIIFLVSIPAAAEELIGSVEYGPSAVEGSRQGVTVEDGQLCAAMWNGKLCMTPPDGYKLVKILEHHCVQETPHRALCDGKRVLHEGRRGATWTEKEK